MVPTKKSLSKQPLSAEKSKRPPRLPRVAQVTQSETLAQFFDNFEVGVAHLLPSGEVIYSNSRFSSALGIPPQRKVVGHNLSEFVTPHSWEPLQDALRQAVHGPVEGELTVSITYDTTHTVRLLFSPQQVEGRPVIRIVADEVTELVEANLHLRQTEASL